MCTRPLFGLSMGLSRGLTSSTHVPRAAAREQQCTNASHVFRHWPAPRAHAARWRALPPRQGLPPGTADAPSDP